MRVHYGNHNVSTDRATKDVPQPIISTEAPDLSEPSIENKSGTPVSQNGFDPALLQAFGIPQQQLQSQIPQDPFIQHLFNQLQSLIQHLGGQRGPRQKISTPDKLVPVMDQASKQIQQQMASTTLPANSAPGSAPNLIHGILLTLQNFIAQIQSGQIPDLQTLGSQMTQALQQTPGAVPQNPQPGNISMEVRKLPPGVDQKKALEKSKELNEAIKEKDFGKLQELAKDKDAMAMASPAEKAALVQELSSRALTEKDEGKRDEAKAAINFVLRSAGSGEEFRAIMQTAGPQVQQALMSGVQDPQNDRHLADFNIAAGALGAADLATDPSQAKLASDAAAKGYTPKQILEARDKMARSQEKSITKFGREDGEIKAFAEDPICMAVSTPQEKSGMIKQLMDGYTTGSEDRAMVSILQSANNKAEYEQIVNGAGGKKIVEEMDNDEAKKKFDLLAGAYDCPDLAMDQAAAAKSRGALTDPARTQYLMGGADQNVIQPQSVDAASAVSPQNANDPVMAKTDEFIANQNAKINAQVNTLDRRAAVETVLENAQRDSEGKTLLNPRDLRNEVNAVMNKPGLDKDEREKQVEELRKKYGVSEYTMRNIATQPISHIYNEATIEAAGFMQANGAPLEEDVKRAEAQYGKDSPQAQQARARLEKFQSRIGSHTANLQRIGSELGEMYPPPKDFLECLGDFLLGALKAFGPLLLNLIPGAGTALFAGYQAVKTVVSAVQGDILGVIGGVAGILPGVGNLVGGAVGAAVQGSKQAIDTGLSLARGVATGNVLEIANAAGGIAGQVSKFSGELGQFGAIIKEGVDVARQGLDLGKGILGGDLSAITKGAGIAANGLEKLGGPESAFSTVADYTRQGIGLVNTVQNGDYLKALQTLGIDAKSVLNNPIAQQLSAYSEKGISFMNNVSNGNYAGALGNLSQGLSGLDNPLARELSDRAQQGSQFLTDLSNGNYAAAINGFDGALASFVGAPAAAEVTKRIGQFSQLAADVRNGDLTGALGTISQATGLPVDQAANAFVRDARALLQDAANGEFRKSFESLGADVKAFLNSNELKGYGATVAKETEFFRAITTGEFTSKLETLKTQIKTHEGLIAAGIQSQIDTALALSYDAKDFLSKTLNVEFQDSLRQAQQWLNSSQDFQTALAEIQKNGEYFRAVVSGDALSSIRQYESNLQSFLNTMNATRLFERFKNESRALLGERNLNELLTDNYNEAREELLRQKMPLEQTVRTMQSLSHRF